MLSGSWTGFQSTHSLRSATLVRKVLYCAMSVSIHALLAECDLLHIALFQFLWSFNPRTPCGVRLTDAITYSVYEDVSIHALLAECDRKR